jgi:hypothetical protein
MSGLILDATGGVMTSIETDEGAGKTHIRVQQDVENIIDANKAGQNSGHDGYNRDRSMRHLAEVPFGVIHQWMMDDGLPVRRYFQMSKAEKEAYVTRKLNDPNWAYLRAFWQNPVHSRVIHAKSI